MSDTENLLQVLLENLYDCDREEAIFNLRTLADELEEGAELTSDMVENVLSIMTRDYEI